jgi:hypothetical protein
MQEETPPKLSIIRAEHGPIRAESVMRGLPDGGFELAIGFRDMEVKPDDEGKGGGPIPPPTPNPRITDPADPPTSTESDFRCIDRIKPRPAKQKAPSHRP